MSDRERTGLRDSRYSSVKDIFSPWTDEELAANRSIYDEDATTETDISTFEYVIARLALKYDATVAEDRRKLAIAEKALRFIAHPEPYFFCQECSAEDKAKDALAAISTSRNDA
jgi:hypothetical protein